MTEERIVALRLACDTSMELFGSPIDEFVKGSYWQLVSKSSRQSYPRILYLKGLNGYKAIVDAYNSGNVEKIRFYDRLTMTAKMDETPCSVEEITSDIANVPANVIEQNTLFQKLNRLSHMWHDIDVIKKMDLVSLLSILLMYDVVGREIIDEMSELAAMISKEHPPGDIDGDDIDGDIDDNIDGYESVDSLS